MKEVVILNLRTFPGGVAPGSPTPLDCYVEVARFPDPAEARKALALQEPGVYMVASLLHDKVVVSPPEPAPPRMQVDLGVQYRTRSKSTSARKSRAKKAAPES